MSGFFVGCFVGLCILLYFVPWMIAAYRNHHQRSAIVILNIFLGWSFIGWLIALIWSVSKIENDSSENQISPTEELLKLSELKDKGILSSEEFEQKREKILKKI